MTDADLAIEAEVSRWRTEREQERDAAHAHMVAGFQREKRLKPLKHYIRRPTRKLSRDEAELRRREFEEISKRLGD